LKDLLLTSNPNGSLPSSNPTLAVVNPPKNISITLSPVLLEYLIIFSTSFGGSSFCTNLSECGVSITNLQTLMGHQSISTAALYINDNPKILGKITASMSM